MMNKYISLLLIFVNWYNTSELLDVTAGVHLIPGVPTRDALRCAYAHCTEIRPPTGWRKSPGRPRETWLHQIGDGSAASIRQEWNLAVGRGHSR